MTLADKLNKALVVPKKVLEAEFVEEASQVSPPSIIQLVDWVLEQRKRTFNFFRPSMIAKCERANVFHYRRATQSPGQQDPRLHRILDTGTALHSVFQGYLADLHDWWFVPEARVYEDVDGSFVRGSCDGVLIHRKTRWAMALELKTIKSSVFKTLTKAQPDHVKQALIYAHLQKLPGTMIVYWDKDTSNLKEYWYPVDEKQWAGQKAHLTHLKIYVDNNTFPAYDPSTCDIGFCNFVEVCRKRGAPV